MNVRAALVAATVMVAGLYATPVVAAAEGHVPAKVQTEKGKKDGYRPPEGAFFNWPIGNAEAQHRIENVIQAAIRHAKKDSFIQIALFSFDRRPIAEDLINAYKRGVHVQVLLNDHQVTRAMRMMNQAFGHSLKRKSWIRVCHEGCRAHSENLHSKFYLFSKTGVAEKTTITGSVNLTTNALIHQWNDGLVVHNDKVYDTFRSVFKEMKHDKDVKRPYEVFNINKRYQLQVLPFMNATRHHDPIMTVLNKIRCQGANKGTGSNGRTTVRVDMHRWAGHRGAYLASKIVDLWAAGCDVKVMHGSASEEVRTAITRNTPRGRVPIRSNGFDEDGDGVIDRYTHHKYLVISGHYGKSTHENRIYTGSSNWAPSGLRGDEIIFRARGPRLVHEYLDNFNYIWNHGSRPIPYGRARMAAAEPRIGGKYWEND
jgi:phosphatidylserine/phosphatidylglycerophosphate/cardiolipin synthase-like enzyme